MITSMTAAQKARIPEWVEKYIRIGLDTSPADRKRAERGIRILRKASKLKEVPIIWVSSPLVGGLAAPLAAIMIEKCRGKGAPKAVYSAVGSAVGSAVDSAVGSAVNSAVGSAVDSAVYSAVDSAVGSAVDSAVGSAVRSAVYSAVDSAKKSTPIFWHDRFGGRLWSSYVAWFTFHRDVLGVKLPEVSEGWEDLYESAGWWWANQDFDMVSENPTQINRDGNGRLHAEDGMAIQYPDNWGLYSWHGVTVDAQTICFPETLTAKICDQETNAEVRRVKIERMGPGKYLQETKAKVLDMDALTIGGAAPRALMVDGRGEKWLCGTDGSTKRVYFMSVPREAKSCREAHNLIAGFDETRLLMEA